MSEEELQEELEEELALCKRAKETKTFRWMTGMQDQYGNLIEVVEDVVFCVQLFGDSDLLEDINAVFYPNVFDPGTQGCILSLIREQTGKLYYAPTLFPIADPEKAKSGKGWATLDKNGHIVMGISYAEALVYALERCDNGSI